MTDRLYRSKDVQVMPIQDLIEVRMGRSVGTLHYRSVIELCAGIRTAAKHAMSFDRAPHHQWREIADLGEREGDIPKVSRNSGFRASGMRASVGSWSIDVTMSADIVIILDNVQHRMHFSDALVLHELLRAVTKVCKGWAGDTSKHFTVTGVLTDAEKNAAQPILY